jgi:hypothetical protein
MPVPSIHFTDDEIPSSREEQPRPQSPNVEQIAERNQPPPPTLVTTSTSKTRNGAGKKQNFFLSTISSFLILKRWTKTKRTTTSITSKY